MHAESAPRPPRQLLVADQHHYCRAFEATLTAADVTLLRGARAREAPCSGTDLPGSVRQVIESTDDILEAQLDLESCAAIRRRLPAAPCSRVWP